MALKLVQGKQLNTNLTGSFTGSFKGDGSLLTGVTGEWDGTLNGNAQITGSLSQGIANLSTGLYSHAEGYNTQALEQYSHAEGYSTVAAGLGTHAEGVSSTSQGTHSHAEGDATTAIGIASHAEGSLTYTGILDAFITLRSGGVVDGLITLESVYDDVTSNFTAGGYLYLYDDEFDANYGWSSFLIDTVTFNGTNTEIQLVDITVSTSEACVGDLTYLKGNQSFGGDGIIPGPDSHAEGIQTKSIGPQSHAEGQSTYTLGISSHAEGRHTQAIGNFSHAEGAGTQAIGESSHAEGADTISSGSYSHAEGRHTQAIGNFSHAEGQNTQAVGDYSHAEGLGTIALARRQHVQGTYNITSSIENAFIIGNGAADNTRSNLLFAAGDSVQITGSLIISTSGSFVLPLTASSTPQVGSAYWSGSLLFVYNGTRYMSASFF